ncbi:MAG: GWxTD domain-containing protein, partial [Candidatus Kapaibacterium sp.]
MLRIILLPLLTVACLIMSHYSITAKENYFLDAVVFNSSDSTDGRIDVYIVVPYQLLTFEKLGENFVANIDVDITITDEDNNKVGHKHFRKTITTDDYRQSQGAAGEFYKAFFKFGVPKGTFNVSADIKDEFNGNLYERDRDVTVIDFNRFSFSLSGILLLSQIEEIDGKYKITPFISDNIGAINSDFFTFFEIYNSNEPKKVKITYRLLKKDNVITEGELKEVDVKVGVNQKFLRIDASNLSLSGEYIVQVIAYDLSATEHNDKKVLALTQRSIKHNETLISFLEEDINKAIKMLRYVATDAELDKIADAKTDDLKREKLSLFWKELDPSPNTVFNEAMNEYYQRIKYANEQFKSYTEGWLTDMGMVYVVLGPPIQVERQTTLGNNFEYRLWQYS